MPSGRSTGKAVVRRKPSSGTPRQTKRRRVESDEEAQKDGGGGEASGEDFGLTDINSDDDEEPIIISNNPRQRSPTKQIPSEISNLHLKPPNYEPSDVSTRDAKDIGYFFARGNKKTGQQTICIFCRWISCYFAHSSTLTSSVLVINMRRTHRTLKLKISHSLHAQATHHSVSISTKIIEGCMRPFARRTIFQTGFLHLN